ncbi:MAG: D-alanyl-D-alanine carboxypeptidase [Gammaproteobacteria bacterium]|nr:MAG: D-alanyl-D-alanine carboxypeptidase [Gammaproteobacteria bacterium]
MLRAPLLLLLWLWLNLAAAAAPLPVPSPPDVGARAWLLMDYHSGRVLAEKNADQPLPPASLTKLMTAYVVFRELEEGTLHLDDPVTISEKAWRTEGSRMFVEVGSKVKVRDLLQGMIVQSGNDATVALAEHVAGTEATFAEYMNRFAQELGMTHSHFVNSTGMPDPDHYVTARDVAHLAAALIRDFPEYYKWFSEKTFTWNGITQHNRNRLLWQDPSVDGLKTGHTEKAGYCLVTSAKRGGMRLISVVMGARSDRHRTQASQALLNYGFRFFETHKLYDAGQKLADMRVWKGRVTQLPVGPARAVYVTIPRGRYKDLKAHMRLRPRLVAPVARGHEVGRIEIDLDDETVQEVPLVALQEVPEGGFWQRVKDEILLYFE